MANHILMVLTNAIEGQDDEFNDWYNNRHLFDVVNLEGFVAAQRHRMDSPFAEGPQPLIHQYLAIYEIPEGQLDIAKKSLHEAIAKRNKALAEGLPTDFPRSEAMALDFAGYWFTQISDRVDEVAVESLLRAQILDRSEGTRFGTLSL